VTPSPIQIIVSNLPALEPVATRPVRPAGNRGGKASKSPAIEASVSALAVLLAEEGLEFNRSSVSSTAEHLKFKLYFAHQESEKLMTDGNYSRSSRTPDLNLQYVYRATDNDSHPPARRSFEVQIHLTASEVRSKTFSPFTAKENIMSPVHRLLGDLQALAQGVDVSLGRVELRQEDLAELYTQDRGRLARSLENLIQLIMLMARLKEILEGDQPDLAPEPAREETAGKHASGQQEKLLI